MGRPQKDENERVRTLGATVVPSVDTEIETIAKQKDRSKAYVAGQLLLRGLYGFREDGELTVEEPPKPVRRTTSSKPRKPSRAAIRAGLDNARGAYGKPPSKKDRETIQREIEKDADLTEDE